MSQIPHDYKFTKSHEWARLDEDGNVTIGITDHAQTLLGDIVFIEQPEFGTDIQAGDECGVVESVKAASDIYCPISGEVVGVNEALSDSPELVNRDAYGEGWLFRVAPHDEADLHELLDAETYSEQIEGEAH